MTEIERYTERDTQVSAQTKDYIEAGVSKSTRSSYQRDLAHYLTWCEAHQRTAIPATPETFAEFVGSLCQAGLSPSTIRRSMTAIGVAHDASKQNRPNTKGANFVLRGYRRTDAQNYARPGPAPALLLKDLRKVVEACDPATIAGVRDRALIVLGWAMMGRRSELAALNLEDVREADDGIDILIRQSKTDQDAKGATVSIPPGEHPETCPVTLLRAWIGVLEASGQRTGPLFRPIDKHGHVGGSEKFAGRSKGARMTPQAVEVVIDRATAAAGLGAKKYRPHSLRAGPVTQAYISGADPLAISRHGRWADNSPVFLGYVREAERKRNNPMKGIGL